MLIFKPSRTRGAMAAVGLRGTYEVRRIAAD